MSCGRQGRTLVPCLAAPVPWRARPPECPRAAGIFAARSELRSSDRNEFVMTPTRRGSASPRGHASEIDDGAAAMLEVSAGHGPVAPASSGGAPASSWSVAQPWVSLGVRLVLAGVALWAGVAKISDLEASVRAVRAYDLLPGALADVVGYALPMLEILIGLLLLIGLLTRYVAGLNGLLMLGFVVGVASAWARGLSIDCGCFGGGGQVDPEETEYLTVILRDAALVLGSAFLVGWPRSKFSADGALRLDP